MRLNKRGEYEYIGLDTYYNGPVSELLRVSAFGGMAPDEESVAADLYASQDGVSYDPISGYSVGSFAGWTEEGDLRAAGSSGGLTTWLLGELLRLGHVDGIVHMRTGGPEGQLFTYQISRTLEDIRAGAKSRYFPGEMSDVLREIHQVPGHYAVVGIPSFIYEIRLLQRTDPLFRDRIRYLVGLICGHQKTANYADYLAWRAGIPPGGLRSIDFRKKVPGEPADRYSTEFIAKIDGVDRTCALPQTKIFGTDWGLGFFKSNFSDLTQDAFNETADIVLGDAWLPEYTADGRGTNVVLVRDRFLLDLLMRGAASGCIYLERIGVDRVVRSPASLVRQSILEAPYRLALLAKRGEPTPVLRRSPAERLPAPRKAVQRMRVLTSRASHSAYLAALQSGSLDAFDRVMRPLAVRYRLAQRADHLQRALARGPRHVASAVLHRVNRRPW